MALELENPSLSVRRNPAFAELRQEPARPFLKWVGGKNQLLKQLDSNMPGQLKDGRLATYVEPFVGGGAVFFHVAHRYPIKRFILADNNPDLIMSYWVIKEKVGKLIAVLHEIQSKYLKLSDERREAFYYKMREEFNSEKSNVDLTAYSPSWLRRTAILIFLNKTCFNGLFRVNSSGLFNASFGRYKNPKICDPDNLVEVSFTLRKAEIHLCDFQETLKFIDSETFVYIDPPYRPLTETANFTSYSPTTFTALDQQRLALFCQRIIESRALMLVSNSDPSNVDPDDNYFEETYPDCHIIKTTANRMINCRADKRGKINELLIMNYSIEQRHHQD